MGPRRDKEGRERMATRPPKQRTPRQTPEQASGPVQLEIRVPWTSV